jgi:hypothetical protein
VGGDVYYVPYKTGLVFVQLLLSALMKKGTSMIIEQFSALIGIATRSENFPLCRRVATKGALCRK